MLEDLPARYDEYLERFARLVGEVAAGSFAKYDGRLIKKLSFEEFSPAFLEYYDILARYEDSVARGDTINDVIVRLVRERAAELVLTSPV